MNQEHGLELPEWLIQKLAQRYDGMTSIDRFIVETVRKESKSMAITGRMMQCDICRFIVI